MKRLTTTTKAVAKAIVDPVCGMFVSPGKSELVSFYNGEPYYFCAEGCRKAFEENPKRYLKPKGFFGRFLDRLATSNEKQFGPKGPSCCQ